MLENGHIFLLEIIKTKEVVRI